MSVERDADLGDDAKRVGCQGPRGYPVARMAFQLLLLSFIGTVYAFSAWSPMLVGPPPRSGPFPTWSSSDLAFIYSMGILGAFSTPFGGYIYDTCGATVNFMLGPTIMTVCFCGIYAVSESSLSPSCKHMAVGMLYFLEELGSGTVYMGVCMDTLLRFPPATIATSIGLVTTGYSSSSILASLLLSRLEVTIWQFFAVITCGVVTLSAVRVWLGPLAMAPVSEEFSSDLEAPLLPVSYSAAFTSRSFRTMMLLAVLALSPCTALIGIAKATGDAAGGEGAELAILCMVANLVGRLVGGFGFDLFRHRLSSLQAVILLEAGLVCSFFGVLACCMFWEQAPRAIAILVFVAILFYGAHAPLASVFVKDSFPAEINGVMLGVFCIGLALSNFVFNSLFLPATVSKMHDLEGMFMSSEAMCLACLCLTFLNLRARLATG